ncbi:trigger factor [Metamycoplasma canadense]|uniref:Trigger factor n=1 Tax=Metamycoplasma canadense TaxID=29554 RepID=A0A077LBR0_9BACT|nr:trigger factor [Metamycoplasma canadense]BAP39569.1 trigger factor [Metamycoplasma canadense]
MSRKFNKENTELIIDYIFEGEQLSKAIEKAQRSLASDVIVPGFRKGKAPLKEALKRIDHLKVLNKVIKNNINDIYSKEIISQLKDEDKILENFEPVLDLKEVNEQKIVFEFTYALFPSVKLGDFKKLETKLLSYDLTDEDFEQAKKSILDNYMVMLDSEEPIKLGDKVNFDFIGFINGEKFEGGEAEKFDLVIGSKQFIPGFEEQMIGLKKGETKDLNLKFPENYHAKDLAGKDVIFRVTINKVQTPNYPEINEQFLKEVKVNPLVNDLETFNQYLKIVALKEKMFVNNSNFVQSAIAEISSKSEIKMSSLIEAAEAEKYYNGFVKELKQKGINEKDYFEFANTSKDDILSLYKKEANKNLSSSFVMGKIVEVENLGVTDEEFNSKVKELSDLYGLKEEQIKTFLTKQRFDQEQMSIRIFERLAELNNPEGFKKYLEINKEVKEYESKVQNILIEDAKVKSKKQVEEMTKEK